jgi:CheY-like chemotaxis protein
VAEHVLVVDDEEPIREIVGSMLRRGGYEIQAVESGNQALATLRSGARFHLILTNLMMASNCFSA